MLLSLRSFDFIRVRIANWISILFERSWLKWFYDDAKSRISDFIPFTCAIDNRDNTQINPFVLCINLFLFDLLNAECQISTFQFVRLQWLNGNVINVWMIPFWLIIYLYAWWMQTFLSIYYSYFICSNMFNSLYICLTHESYRIKWSA